MDDSKEMIYFLIKNELPVMIYSLIKDEVPKG
jgi:hypothetical protein